ncbi:hypothetical protein UUU_37880 [Klebsiella pneumoniae subsp. pneumoniae DSM 30104 = JCM 1662 = NBRC 14940]|nr:hypothetical protein UUU_37880 [Klebsiella pneumoniae subsp. pneumoniae DSM 30104 = JCM 1662 = NBRC 14940]
MLRNFEIDLQFSLLTIPSPPRYYPLHRQQHRVTTRDCTKKQNRRPLGFLE